MTERVACAGALIRLRGEEGERRLRSEKGAKGGKGANALLHDLESKGL